ncbi:MAG TPA: D-glycero-beta-D-manno-heptose 1-phosphate adenylyltransferase [Flavisolibacter sp.]|nr:D-glycero-beta-D-manno-heptose 1-phosphate adenylyltransferase [Flavisolibacter sp.]
MRSGKSIEGKLISPDELEKKIAQWRILGKKVAFTNGCFDIIHTGHIASLMEAAQHGDYLVIGLNSDASVKRLKGPERPINTQESRALVLAALTMVDAVVLFEEDTPLELIKKIMPDVLVKGGDYTVEQIAGAKEVIANGGKVVINPIVEGFSTTNIIEKFRAKN